MSKYGARVWIQKSDELAKKMSELQLSYDAKCREHAETINEHDRIKTNFETAQDASKENENVIQELKNKLASAEEQIKKLTEENSELKKKLQEIQIVNLPVEMMDFDGPLDASVVTINAIVDQQGDEHSAVTNEEQNQPTTSNENKCDKCQRIIKGTLNQLRAHQKDHCDSKPINNLPCPVCRTKYNYNGLRYHLKYYAKEETICKATGKYLIHRSYTAEQHLEIRKTLVKTAEKLKVDGGAIEQNPEELLKLLLDFVKKLPKREVEQAETQVSEDDNSGTD